MTKMQLYNDAKYLIDKCLTHLHDICVISNDMVINVCPLLNISLEWSLTTSQKRLHLWRIWYISTWLPWCLTNWPINNGTRACSYLHQFHSNSMKPNCIQLLPTTLNVLCKKMLWIFLWQNPVFMQNFYNNEVRLFPDIVSYPKTYFEILAQKG